MCLKGDHLSVNEHFPNMVEKDMNYNDITPVYTSDPPLLDILTKLADIIGRSEMENVLDRAIVATKPMVGVDTPPSEEVAEEE